MDGNQMKRIEAFLKARNLDLGAIPKQRINQLIKIDNAVQKRINALSEAQEMLRNNSISIVAIAADSGITRKTFYNNDILKQYVESFISIDGEPSKMVKASEIESMKRRLEDQAADILKMVARDIDIESARHEADELRKVIKGKDQQIQNLTEMYEVTLSELRELRAATMQENILMFPSKES